jgi:diacylglycerol kinase (ATP)
VISLKHIFLISQNVSDDINFLVNKIHASCQTLGYDSYAITIVGCNEELLECAKKCSKGDYIVYAVGDDKEINVVLNGLINGEAKLGVIPVGYNNDFYRSLDEYRSDSLNVNVMSVNGKYGLNVFSLGIYADICANVEKFKNLPLPPKALYYLNSLYTFLKYRNQVMGVNDFFQKNTLLAVCNGSYYRGGCKIAPRVFINSPSVGVTMVEDMTKLQTFFWLEVMEGICEETPKVDMFTTDEEIHIETMNLLNGQVDGEVITGNEFRVIPHAGNIEVVNNRRLIRELRK